MSAITAKQDQPLTAVRGAISLVGWQAPADLTVEEWADVGRSLGSAQKMMGWVIGDWLCAAAGKWGEMYAEAMELTGLGYNRLKQLKWLSERVDLCLRNHNLTVSHHQEVAPLPPDDQQYWLLAAETNAWSVRLSVGVAPRRLALCCPATKTVIAAAQ